MTIPIIEKTKNYDQFKFLNFNREKNKMHIQNLKRIILQNNLLPLHPILVNNEMEVVDGQHRLAVAKELDLDIFFIKSEVPYSHILGSNLYQRNLSLLEVIKFYAVKDQIPSYLFLCTHLDRLKIKPKALLGAIFGGTNKPILDFIKTGKFLLPNDIPQLNKILDSLALFMNFIEQKRIRPVAMFTNSKFTVSYRNLVLLSDFDEDIWFKKLEQRWFDLKPQMNVKEWSRVLIGIYNWKNHSPMVLPSYG